MQETVQNAAQIDFQESLERIYRPVIDQLKKAVKLALPLEDPISIIQVTVPDIDLLRFIKKQPFTVKGFWSPPYCQDIIWMGFILASGELSDEFIDLLPREGRIYGGMRFFPKGKISPEWEPFGKAIFIVPRFEKRGDTFLCYLKKEDTVEKVFQEIDRIEWALEPLSCSDKRRIKQSCFEEWANKVKKIQNSSFEKLVLAKRIEVESEEIFCPWSVLQKIKREESFSWAFAIDGAAFVGVSPERLFTREGTKISSEAIAGTRPTSTEPLLDVALREELLHSKKEIHEHAFVTKHIEFQLNRLCTQVHVGTLSTLAGAGVQHLIRRFSGILKSNIAESNIIEALHPTPAVGGLPKEQAYEKIYEIEGFDRGWYAGAIGWAQKDSSEFAVGIRSCLIRGKKLYWYSGCGIVNESDAEKEWEEAELKAQPFIEAL